VVCAIQRHKGFRMPGEFEDLTRVIDGYHLVSRRVQNQRRRPEFADPFALQLRRDVDEKTVGE
jgi:hypothetical protein